MISQSEHSTQITKRDYIVVTVKGASYKYEMPFAKGTTVQKILMSFDITSFLKVDNVVKRVGKKKSIIDLLGRVDYDCSLEVIYKD